MRMRPAWSIFAAAAIAATCEVNVGLAAEAVAKAAEASGGRWHRDLDQAARVARASGRPLFIVFRCER